MEQVAASALKSGRLGAVLRVWRRGGWPGVAWRLRARLGWLGLPAPRRLPRPELIEITRPREGFTAGIHLPAAPAPLVSVVVPALDHVEYTLLCLAALARRPSAASFEVIVVDDGSTDDSARLLPTVPNLVYLRNETTLGFVRSVNRAARTARGRFLFLLNNDTQVQPGWLDELVAAFDESRRGDRRVEARRSLRPSAGGGRRAARRRDRRARRAQRRPAARPSTTSPARSTTARGPAS